LTAIAVNLAPVVGVGRDLGPAAGGGCPLPDLEKASFGTASSKKIKYSLDIILVIWYV
jgi:hypothetical protein